jgi:hypothetical protein
MKTFKTVKETMSYIRYDLILHERKYIIDTTCPSKNIQLLCPSYLLRLKFICVKFICFYILTEFLLTMQVSWTQFCLSPEDDPWRSKHVMYN